MAATGPGWSDFQDVRESVRHMTVERLKTIFSHLDEELGRKLSKQGNKGALIDRLQKFLDEIRTQRLEESYSVTKNIIRSVRTYGHYQPTNGYRPPAPTGTYPSSHTAYHPYPGLSSNNLPSRPAYNPYSNHGASTSAPAPNGTNGTNATNNATQNNPRQIRFKPSPFYRIDQPLNPLVLCQENKDGSERRSQHFTFTLTQDQSEKLQTNKYQVRLYCTSSTHYAPNSFTNAPVPIEFPPTCEIRVNNKNINASVRGLKKKPGTAPPPNLTPFMSTTKGTLSKVELIYVNNVTPFVPKKFYMLAQLVEVTTVREIVTKLKAGKQRSKDDVLDSMRKAAQIDADIEAGPQKMSLKCPASYIRINTPCRSSTCVHPQCFDAENWFSMMEQTTTWACPVCDKTLNTEELIIDMYFDDILKCTPDMVEDVIVEANGEWHTEDDKYGSPAWVSTATSRPRPVEKERKVKAEPETRSLMDSSAEVVKPKTEEYLVVDSDDEDDTPLARYVPPPKATSSLPQAQIQAAVIDLTLSSDDEDDDPPPHPSTSPPAQQAPIQTAESAGGSFKRKERSPASQSQDVSWKRHRVEHPANGFTGASSEERRIPVQEPPNTNRPPSASSHNGYTPYPHSSPPVAPMRPPDYSPPYGYNQQLNSHRPLPHQYGHGYNGGYVNGANRYTGYAQSAPYSGEAAHLPFTANGRPPTLPRPTGPGAQNSNNNRGGDMWY
ncbi:E3 SUMO-protein ligase pli1 OS=Schizosaccharomyces pombe (strain 972 / ATCC 24843) GN=pli1 PE=1 SV=3 [Rhizoctonia solani AG-1 IB]|uniref:E3 SUMO-protein ligase pli1 n=1 Tax=Thanatephorus cucumeris (strain AG1-IB / isolate 7/3/14) TaxID=1108050 RepID=A0A0B7FIM7_THACB|nr:E3 SUMO-protein ligase pli1 OS=Schizosaccharomyces pombe (strain 972 / ATCC 24843) GN=pli1 PE=1 SV=3 [Rhizoctonia solani AG-1 IB]